MDYLILSIIFNIITLIALMILFKNLKKKPSFKKKTCENNLIEE